MTCKNVEAHTNHQSKPKCNGNWIWHGDLLTNGENLHKPKILLGEFQIITPKNPLIKNKRLQI